MHEKLSKKYNFICIIFSSCFSPLTSEKKKLWKKIESKSEDIKTKKKLQDEEKKVNLQKTLKCLVNSINQLTIAYVYCKRNYTIFKRHTYPLWSIAICCYCSCWCYVYRDMTLDLHSKSHFSSSIPSSYFPSLVYCINIFICSYNIHLMLFHACNIWIT